jgi:hypothetical protein
LPVSVEPVDGEFIKSAVERRTRQLAEPDNGSQAPTMQHVFADVNAMTAESSTERSNGFPKHSWRKVS